MTIENQKPATTTTETPLEEVRLEEAGALGKVGRVDRAAGLVEDVKILGMTSANGNDYAAAALDGAVPLYEGVKVNLNHRRPGETGPRRVEDRLGRFESVRRVPEGLRGNLRFNPDHPFAKQFCWFAENMPDAVGMSHDAVGRGRKVGSRFLVEEISGAKFVDLVADPATAKGLFEATGTESKDEKATQESKKPEEDARMSLKEATLEQLKTERRDLVEAVLQESKASDESKAKEAETKKLLEELDAYKVKEAVAAKRAIADKAIAEAKLSKEAVSDRFIETLLSAKDEADVKALVEDRRKLVFAGNRPKSKEQVALQESAGLAALPLKDFIGKVVR